MTDMTTLSTRAQTLGIVKFIFFGRPLLRHHYHILVLSYLCSRIEKKIFKGIQIHQLYSYYSKIMSPLGWDPQINNFMSPPTGATYMHKIPFNSV